MFYIAGLLLKVMELLCINFTCLLLKGWRCSDETPVFAPQRTFPQSTHHHTQLQFSCQYIFYASLLLKVLESPFLKTLLVFFQRDGGVAMRLPLFLHHKGHSHNAQHTHHHDNHQRGIGHCRENKTNLKMDKICLSLPFNSLWEVSRAHGSRAWLLQEKHQCHLSFYLLLPGYSQRFSFLLKE